MPKTYTKPGTRLRRAEVRHMLNGFVTKVVEDGTISNTMNAHLPRRIARRLVLLGPSLGMNYRIVRVGNSDMLLGRPIREEV